MSSNEFNELLNSLKSNPIVETDNDETLYVWKPVPIVSSPFQNNIANSPKFPLESNIPTPTEVSVPTTTFTIDKPPIEILQSLNSSVTSSQSSYVTIPETNTVLSYNPPSTIVPPIELAQIKPLHDSVNLNNGNGVNNVQQTIQKVEEKSFWFEWSMYIFGFSLMLFIVFFALWYFYVKDYNKKYPLEVHDKIEKIPPPSYLQNKILEENPHFTNEYTKPPHPSQPEPIEFNVEEAEKLIEEEYFKPEAIIENLLDEKKKKKKSFFDLSDVDSSEFDIIKEKPVFFEGKLSDESDEVKKYAEKRAKLFDVNN